MIIDAGVGRCRHPRFFVVTENTQTGKLAMLQPALNDAKSKAYAVNGSNNYNQTIDAQIWGDVPGRLAASAPLRIV